MWVDCDLTGLLLTRRGLLYTHHVGARLSGNHINEKKVTTAMQTMPRPRLRVRVNPSLIKLT